MVNAGKLDSIRDVLKDYSAIAIADYQRNYEWTREQIDELWTDVVTSVESDREHFLGNLVIQELGDKSCELVDGQQRITTIFLFIGSLRDQLQLLGLNEIQPVNKKERAIPVNGPIEDFLYGQGVAKAIPRYTLNVLLKDLGEIALSKFEESPDERDIPKRAKKGDVVRSATLNFRKAYWHIRGTVEKDLARLGTDELKLHRIYDLSRGFLDRLRVLPVTTASKDEALNVFMTINDRGLPLGVFDLVRGQVLKAITRPLDEAEAKVAYVQGLKDWEEILDDVKDVKPDQFLRHHFLSAYPDKVTAKDVPRFASGKINEKSPDADQRAKAMWESIRLSAEIYDRILRPSHAIGAEAMHHLACLEMISDSYRILMLRVLHPESNLTPDQSRELIRLLFVGVTRWTIAGGNAQELETKLQVGAQLLITKGYSECLSHLRDLCETQCDVAGFLAEDVSIRWAKSLLLAIESAVSSRANPLDLSKLHLEHIAPQKGTEHWLAIFDGCGREYVDVFSDVGNLTILDEGLNQKVKRKPFAEKKEDYAKSRCNISSDLVQVKEWDIHQIDKRHEWIVASLEALLQVKPNEVSQYSKWLTSGDKE